MGLVHDGTDQLVDQLFDRPLPFVSHNSSFDNNPNVKLVKLLVDQVNQLEQRLYSISVELHKTKEQLSSLLVKPDDGYQELVSYVNEASKHYSPEDIRQILLSKGWPAQTVDKLLQVISH